MKSLEHTMNFPFFQRTPPQRWQLKICESPDGADVASTPEAAASASKGVAEIPISSI